jgi:hypothetical protein
MVSLYILVPVSIDDKSDKVLSLYWYSLVSVVPGIYRLAIIDKLPNLVKSTDRVCSVRRLNKTQVLSLSAISTPKNCASYIHEVLLSSQLPLVSNLLHELVFNLLWSLEIGNQWALILKINYKFNTILTLVPYTKWSCSVSTTRFFSLFVAYLRF